MIIKIRQPQSFSEIGRKDNQEDFLWSLKDNPLDYNPYCQMFILCDGMGGHDHGEIASRVVAESLGNKLREIIDYDLQRDHISEDIDPYGVTTENMFKEALSFAYDELDKVDTGAVKKMGTTMTCLILHRGGALVAHIGDSRIYHIRPSLSDSKGRSGIIYQTADHSLVNDLLRAGEITEEEAASFPQKNVITRAMQPHLERRYKADIYNIDDVKPGDYFFLCCDGVLEQLNNDLLGKILADSSLDDKGKIAAIKAVCDNNTRDNYTCWLVPIEHVETEPSDVIQKEEIVAVVERENIDDEPTLPPALSCQSAYEANVKTSREQEKKEETLIGSFLKKLFG